MEGFEPSHRLPGLPHFECGPFSHLGTSPCENLYYYISYAGKGQSFLKVFFVVLLTNLPYYNKIMRKMHVAEDKATVIVQNGGNYERQENSDPEGGQKPY